jgi:drug/metabolite transporter (DMT)-like permease
LADARIGFPVDGEFRGARSKNQTLVNRNPGADSRLAVVALFAVTAAWGASFVLMKPAIERQPVPDFLATRFVIATIILIMIRPQVLRSISPRVWWTGGVAGVVLALGYVTQTIGLHFATAAITGFLTGLYVVLTPILAWLMFRQRLNRKVLVAAVLGLTGLGVISLTSFGIGIGEVWIIIGALFFALHIVVLGRWAPGADSWSLTVVQLIVVSVVTIILTFADGDGYVAPPDTDVWIAVLITAVFATALAFLLQTWAQTKLDSSRTAIILTAEVPWAAGLSVAVGQEALATRTIIGGCIMIAAMLIAEWPSRRKPGKGEILPVHPLGHFE